MGELLTRMGRPTEAAIAFRHALELNPEIPTVHARLGAEFLRNDGNVEAALQEYEAELKTSPDDYEANYFAGFLRRLRRDNDLALHHLQKGAPIAAGRFTGAVTDRNGAVCHRSVGRRAGYSGTRRAVGSGPG